MQASHLARLHETPFAVVDVETTGFSPRLNDRVIEVAVVQTDAHGTATDRWTTLVHPNRDLGPTHIHGLVGADMVDAPVFREIAGDLANLLDGRVVVAHNARFDLGFLCAEYRRLGAGGLEWPALCTLGLSRRLGLHGGGKLMHCLAAEGLTSESAHTALGDAVATSSLLRLYLDRASSNGLGTLVDLGCAPIEFSSNEWITWPPLGRTRTREVRAAASFEIPLLSQLVRHLPAIEIIDPKTEANTDAYVDLLGRALADRRITAHEAKALYDTAIEWGLSGQDLAVAHRTYLTALAATALADGVLTDLEDDDLRSVASALGLSRSDVMGALERTRMRAPRAQDGGILTFRGLTVCFTGTLRRMVNGEPMTRDHAQALARAAGLVVQNGVTKKLDLLVVADPDSLSSKARKARDYGTRVVTEQSFWQLLES